MARRVRSLLDRSTEANSDRPEPRGPGRGSERGRSQHSRRRFTDEEADELLREARSHLESAVERTAGGPNPILHGRVLGELLTVLERQGDRDQAVTTGREALTILRPSSDPRECLGAARTLASLLAQRGDWGQAADAFRQAIEASELLFYSRLDIETREEETRRAANLARWAAFALAAAGAPEEAALVIENGRTREIRLRLGVSSGEQARLDQLPEDLRDAYIAASGDLARSPFGSEGAGPSRQLQEIIAAIRRFPSFEEFATGVSIEGVMRAAEPGWPLIYIDPAPSGTLLLCVSAEDGGSVDARILDGPKSLEVLMRLVAGDAADDPERIESDQIGSYLAGIAGYPQADLRLGLAQALPWIGRRIAKPVAELLFEAPAEGATLVPCGPLGLAPLHAAPYDEEGEQCLIDDFEIRYAPSATVAASSLHRAEERQNGDRKLVALADPLGKLPAAVPEVEEIARHFPEGQATIATGAAANSSFLRQHAPEASHLHLATDAGAGLYDTSETAVQLADGLLRADQLTGLVQLEARLVVISACQSAVSEITRMPDEVFSVSTSALAAGSACAIASLWPVDDSATAALMVRFYEEMLGNRSSPPDALRRAQRWLRDLTQAQEAEFLEAHPSLKREVERRAAAGDRPGQRGPGGAPGSDEGSFSNPEYWAPFIAVGA